MGFLLGYFGAAPDNPDQLRRALDRLGSTATPRTLAPRLAVACDGPVFQADLGAGALAGVTLGCIPLLQRIAAGGIEALCADDADGQYALVWHDARTGALTLAHDPFGATRLYHARIGGTRWFATELRALLALAPFSRERRLDLAALHTYLAFSFVAAPRTLIEGIEVVPPNVALTFAEPWATPVALRLLAPGADCPGEIPPPDPADEAGWVSWLRDEIAHAMQRRIDSLDGAGEVAVHLSGGLDSSAVAAWLAREGLRPRLFHLDFGPPYDAERPHAEQVAARLGEPLVRVPVAPGGRETRETVGTLRRLVWQLGEPWGDPATLPLARGYEAVARAGLAALFNGEGGDQLFAGWPNRPMLAADLYGAAGAAGRRGHLHDYLQTFHHFHGLEGALYGPELARAARETNLESCIRPYLDEPALPRFFDRLRWANYWLKGGQNILPRAAALSRHAGIAMHAPYFDRRLARLALRIPGELLLRGTEEKYLLKRAAAGLLPDAVLARPKRGMGVPVTPWFLGPLRAELTGLLASLARRDLFRRDYLRLLARGEDRPGELRGGRRAGERIWQLARLEVWLQLHYDRVTATSPD